MIGQRLRTRGFAELRQFAATASYLFVCFGALILLKSAILRADGLEAVPWGFALVKALLLAKFMLLGQAMHLGERYRTRPLVWSILYKSLAFLVLLVTLSVVEHVAAGLIHGRAIGPSLHEMGGGTAFEAAATTLVLLLVLLPYFAFRTLAEALGGDRLARMMFLEHRPDAQQALSHARGLGLRSRPRLGRGP